MCVAEHNGECYAMACYSSEKCGARDENGNPKYVQVQTLREYWDSKKKE